MTVSSTDPANTSESSDWLRLVWPQWQGAGSSVVEEVVPDLPLEVARRGYSVGTRALEAILPAHRGPAATVPVTMGEEGLDQREGVEAKTVVLDQLKNALDIVRDHDPARITTLGGECSVSLAPFSYLADRYGDDLAVVWIDAHPDIGTPASEYPGYHAMALSHLTGHGDPDVRNLLPATVSADLAALVGLHAWTEDDISNVSQWGIQSFAPDELRTSSKGLLDWLASTGCSRVAIHFDVDVIDSNIAELGLGTVPDGHTTTEVQRIVRDISQSYNVVGMTIAEFFPRQVIHLQQALTGFPLIS